MSVLEVIAAGWDRLDAEVESAVGVTVTALILILFTLVVLKELVGALVRSSGAQRREATIRHDAATFLRRSQESNSERIASWPDRRRRALAEAHVSPMSSVELGRLKGIGPVLLSRVRASGMATLGDVDERVLEVEGIGDTLFARMLELRDDLVAEADAELRRGRLRVEAPGVVAAFDKEWEALNDRQVELERDLLELEELPPGVVEAGGSTAWQRVTQEFGTAMADPMRVLRVVLVLLLAGVSAGAIPLWLLLRDGDPIAIAAASLGFAIGAMFLVATFHWFIADLLVGAFAREPMPDHLEEQVLQFEVIKMAHAAGIVPPVLKIADDPSYNAYALGVRSGPSVVVLFTGLLRDFPPDEVRAVLGHEITHLANNDCRVSATHSFVQAILGVVATFFLALGLVFTGAAAGAAATSGRRRKKDDAGALIAVAFFVAGLGCFATYIFMRVMAVSGVLLRLASGRAAEYRADQGGARLAGGTEHMSDALARIMDSPAPAGSLSRLRYNLIEEPSRMQGGAAAAFEGLFSTHPPMAKRLAAMERPTSGRSLLIGAWMRAAVVVGLIVGLVMWADATAVSSPTEVATVMTPSSIEPTQAPRQALVATPSKAAVSQTVELTATCRLRAGPGTQYDKVATLRKGAECRALASEAGWWKVECPQGNGYVIRNCAKKK